MIKRQVYNKNSLESVLKLIVVKREVRELYFFEQFPFSIPLSSPRSASCESSIHVKARSSFSPVRSIPNLPCIPDAIKAFQNLSNNLSTTFSLESDSQACSRGNSVPAFSASPQQRLSKLISALGSLKIVQNCSINYFATLPGQGAVSRGQAFSSSLEERLESNGCECTECCKIGNCS